MSHQLQLSSDGIVSVTAQTQLEASFQSTLDNISAILAGGSAANPMIPSASMLMPSASAMPSGLLPAASMSAESAMEALPSSESIIGSGPVTAAPSMMKK